MHTAVPKGLYCSILHLTRAPIPFLAFPSTGSSHYYILTDTTDEANAAALGLNHSPKLAFSRGGATTASLDFEKVILVDREGKVSLYSKNM